MLAAVLSAVGIAPEQTALIVGFVLPFDRLLDMTRTVPSACANLAVATTVARWEGELDQIGRAHVELQSLMRISYAVFCLKKKNKHQHIHSTPSILHQLNLIKHT